MAERAAALARLAGTFRREIKADVLTAIWSPDAQDGRTRLLSRLRALESRNIEPALIDGLATGLASCAAATSPGRFTSNKLRDNLTEAGFVVDEIDLKNVTEYWLISDPATSVL